MVNDEVKAKKRNYDIPFLWIIFTIMFVLKLNPGGHLTTVVVDWSWWIIFLPLWIGPVIAFVALGVFGIYLLFKYIATGRV